MKLQFPLTIIRHVLTVAAVVWIGSFFIKHKAELLIAITEFDMSIIAFAAACVLVGLIPGAFAWQQLLAQHLRSVSVVHGILVYLRSGIGKYTPGGLLAFAIQYRLLKSDGAEVVLLLKVFAGVALAACFAAAIISIPAIATLLGEGTLYYCAGLAAITLLGVIPVSRRMKLWSWLSPQIFDRIGVPALPLFLKTVVIMAVAWILTGAHLAVLGLQTGIGPTFFISAYAFSAIVGIVFAVLPGAFGIRDGALLMILILRLDPADALILALLSRALIVAGDAVGAGVSTLLFGWASSTFKLNGASYEKN